MIILASQSPRRREILTAAGIPFEVRVPAIEEVRGAEEEATAYVLRLAIEKALAVAATDEDFVLAADTTVAEGEHVLEKPHSVEDAVRMLRHLSGKEHFVYTGVALKHGGKISSGVETTRVRFLDMSEDEILDYAASGEPIDKAGAYGIQGRAAKFIDRIEGCYFNVMGLPISRVYRMLKQSGYSLARG